MDFSKRGIKKQIKELDNTGTKIYHKFITSLFTLFFLLTIGVISISGSFLYGAYRGCIDNVPQISSYDIIPTGYASFVYDTEGNRTAKLVATNSNRVSISYDMIPQNMVNAVIAIEDQRFYKHNGVDVEGIARAFYVGIKNKHFSEGASTITQQLIKNTVFTDWANESTFMESLKRKLQEQFLAIKVEEKIDKETILVNYLNTINFGSNTLGVQSASIRYFGKQASELTLSECAVLAAIPQNPSAMDPVRHPDTNKRRRDKVLDNMLEQGMISKEEHDRAISDNTYARIRTTSSESTLENNHSYYVDALIDQVKKDLMALGYSENQAYTLIYSSGLKIYSAQDPKIQSELDQIVQDDANYPSNSKWDVYCVSTVHTTTGDINYTNYDFKTFLVENGFISNTKAYFNNKELAEQGVDAYKEFLGAESDVNATFIPQPQLSITVEDQSSGFVLAMVGGRGEKKGNLTLNRAYASVRQPGSLFKVLAVCAPAIDTEEFTLASVQIDEPFNYDNGRPVKNWYAGYRGRKNIRQTIEQSLNICAVKTLTDITPQVGYDYLLKFGFTTLVENETIDGEVFSDIAQPLALGGITKGVTNMELNAAYASIANGGIYYEPKLYHKVVDHDGNVLLDNTNTDRGTRILKEETSFLLIDSMKDVITGSNGTGTAVKFNGPEIAGKTGTTTSGRDYWFSGFSPYYTTSVWVGNDNNDVISAHAEQQLARSMWKKVMISLHDEIEEDYKKFEKPDGIEKKSFCSISGLLASSNCPVNHEYADTSCLPGYCHEKHNPWIVTPSMTEEQKIQAAQAAQVDAWNYYIETGHTAEEAKDYGNAIAIYVLNGGSYYRGMPMP